MPCNVGGMMMRRSLFLPGLVAVISFSAIDPSGIAGEISDMNAYLVQATCPGSLTPNNCASANQTEDLITTPLTFRRLDWPGAYSGIVSDNVLDPSTGAVISTFKTAPFDGPFNPPNDGGDVYMNVTNINRIGDAAIAVKTQTGSLTPIYFVGYTCGYTSWLLFPQTLPTYGQGWGSAVAELGQSNAPGTNCNPRNMAPAYTRYRLENVSMPFLANSVQTTLVIPTVISEHYNGSSIAGSTELERFYFAQGWGKLRWEFWTTSPPSRNLTGECPTVPTWEVAPSFWHAQLTDCRTWTNIIPDTSGWSVSDYGWGWP
jgi:hypothetical protein